MNFNCNTKELNEAVTNVMRAVNAKVTIPTIEGILIECDSNIVSLTGYDFEIGINTTIEANVIESGSIVINAKHLNDIVKKLSGEIVNIEVNGTSVSITSEETKFNIVGINADEYPELPSVNDFVNLQLDKELFISMVSQTIFAAADSEIKPVYTGLKFEIEDNSLTIIGVDGYRLAIRKENIVCNLENQSFIVPKKVLREVIKLFKEEETIIKIQVGKRHIIFETENYSIVGRLLDGEFLDYKAAVPKATTTTVLINTDEMANCIDRMMPVIDNASNTPIRCLFENDQLRISTVSSIGRGVDYIHANTSGDRVEIGFNSRFVIDALKAADTDQVKIELGGPVSPAKIVPMEGDSFLFLVLPMRLKNEG